MMQKLALALCAAYASSARVDGIMPRFGAMTGGTRMVIFGSGFNRDGRQGKTVVYVGTDVCKTIDYDSDDSKITCYTPPAPMLDILTGTWQRTVNVRVTMLTVGAAAGVFEAVCPAGNCQFNYASSVTPSLDFATLGGSAGDLVNNGGTLHGNNINQYTIAVNSPYDKSYALCDVSDDANGRWDENLMSTTAPTGGAGVVRCFNGNIEAGRYNMSVEVRDVAANGFGQPLRRRYAKHVSEVDGRVITWTQSPRITGLSYNAAGMRGGDELTISGNGFSAVASSNVVTLPGGVPCNITFASLTELRCIPGVNAGQQSPAWNVSTPVAFSGGAGLSLAVYRGRNWWAGFPNPNTEAALNAMAGANNRPDEISTNLDALQGKYVGNWNQASDTDTYTQVHSGLFVPQVSANYSFYCRADDLLELLVSPTPLVEGQAPPQPTLRMDRIDGYNVDFFHIRGGPVSRAVFFEAGRKYPIRITHVEGVGGDWFQCGLRVHMEGNAVATARFGSPNQRAFKSVPSVQRITLSATVRREVQRIHIRGALGGVYMLTASVRGVTRASRDIVHPATEATMATAVRDVMVTPTSQGSTQMTAICGDIQVRRVVVGNVPGQFNGTGFDYFVTFNCPLNPPSEAIAWPLLEATSVSLTRQAVLRADEDIILTTSRNVTASAPIQGAFTMSMVNLDTGAVETTQPVPFSDGGWGLVDALSRLPGNLVTGGLRTEMDVQRVTWVDTRDGNGWQITFWAPQGPRSNITVDISGLTGENVAATAQVIEQGSWDALWTPMPIAGWFETLYPRPTVSVVTNGIRAGCNVWAWNQAAIVAGGGPAARPTLNLTAANPCGFEWRSSLTPVITSFGANHLTQNNPVSVGDVITFYGSGFLSLGEGVGTVIERNRNRPLAVRRVPFEPERDGNLTTAMLNIVELGDGSCLVTTVAADGSNMQCRMVATGAGTFTPAVTVRLGRGVAVLPAGGISITVEAQLNSITPSEGSVRGGTLIRINGSGFRRDVATNVVSINTNAGVNIPCTPVSVAEDGLSMVCRTGDAVDATNGRVMVNGKLGTVRFFYRQSRTPVITTMPRRALSQAMSGIMTLTVSMANATANAEAGIDFPATIKFGDRDCNLLDYTYSQPVGSGATIRCTLLRKPGVVTLPQPLVEPLVYVPPWGYAENGSLDLDTGYRVESITPSVVSAHGGALITINGRGFTAQKQFTTVSFYHTGAGAAHAAHAFPCAVEEIDTNGRFIKCRMGSPDAVHANNWLANGMDVIGTVNVTMNRVVATCGRATETAWNQTACGLTFSNSATPMVLNITWNASDTADSRLGTITMTGSSFVPPFHIFFGAMSSLNIRVSADARSVTAAIPPQVAGSYAVQVHSDTVGYGHFMEECHPGHTVAADFFMYDYAFSVDPLPLASVATAGASPAGGLMLAITGTGFSVNNARNLVSVSSWSSTVSGAVAGIGGASAVLPLRVVRSSPTRLLVQAPAMPTGFAGNANFWAFGAITVTVLHKSMNASMPAAGVSQVPAVPAFNTTGPNGTIITTQSSTPFWQLRYSVPGAPALTAVTPAVGQQGTVLSLVGTGFGVYSAGSPSPNPADTCPSSMGMGGMNPTQSAVWIGGAPCIVADASQWSATRINCTVGGTPAGTHRVLVYIPGVGYARNVRTFSSLQSVQGVRVGTNVASLGGARNITIRGAGFASPAAGTGSTNVTLCNTRCAVYEGAYDHVNCTLGPLVTPYSLQYLPKHPEHVLMGRTIASGGSAAGIAATFDGDVETTFTVTPSGSPSTCWVGLDLGADTRAAITRVRFFNTFTSSTPSDFRMGVWEASNDMATWTRLAQNDAYIQEAWTYIELLDGASTGPVADWTNTAQVGYYRYMRFRFDVAANGGNCVGQELEFIGHAVAAAAVANPTSGSVDCPFNVTVAGPTPDPWIGPLATSTASGSTAAPVGGFQSYYTYEVDSTPVIAAVWPSYGSALGGTTVQLTVQNLPPSLARDLSVSFNGVPATVTSVSATSTVNGVTSRVVTVTTGVRDAIRPFDLSFTTATSGKAVVRQNVNFRYLDRWSDITTWANNEPPVEGDTVIVPAGQAVLVDVSPPRLFLVLVEGEMVFDRKDLSFDASYILVHGGKFEVGTEAEPFLNKLTITLHGDRFDSIEIPNIGSKVLAVMNRGEYLHDHSTSDMEFNRTIGSTILTPEGHDGEDGAHSHIMMGMDHSGTGHSMEAGEESGEEDSDPITTLFNGGGDHHAGGDGAATDGVVFGSLEIHGRVRRRVWTKVAATITNQSDIVTTAEDVDWEAGERIVVTSSSYDPTEAEERVIAEVYSPRSFRVTTPFDYEHESRILPAEALGHSNVDARCEVGLLSRNVVIQGDDYKSDSQVFGVHTMAAHGGVYRIENAELRRCGQQGQLGRYCTHQHMRGNAPGNYVRYNSIHHSYQRAVTVHATNYATVKHNFAYHVVGHTIFVEDGVERYNVIEENLVALTLPCFMCLKGDTKPASFWAASVENIWRHNVAAGCLGGGCNGYWHELPGNPHGPSYTPNICPVGGHLIEFFNNTARANDKGLRIYPAYFPYQDSCNSGSGSFPVYYRNFTAIRNRDNGIFTRRGGDIHHINSKTVETAGVDNNWVMFFNAGPYDWDPNYKDLLSIGSRNPGTVSIVASDKGVGLHMPQNEFFFVDGATFVNYDSFVGGRVESQGAISTCNGCDSDQFMMQGGYTYRMQGLKFVNTTTRVRWSAPYKDNIFDLDATLTGSVNGTAVPHYRFNTWPECPVSLVPGRYSTFGNGRGTFVPARTQECDGSTRVRRISIDAVTPRELDYQNMNIAQWNIPAVASDMGLTDVRSEHAAPVVPYFRWFRNDSNSDTIQFRVRDSWGWVFPLVTNRRYNLRWTHPSDWRTNNIRYSEPEYLADLASPGQGTGEWTGVSFNWIDQRYRNRALYRSTFSTFPGAVSSSGRAMIDLPTNEVTSAAPRFDAPFGSSHLPDGNKTWHTMLNARYVVNGTDLTSGPVSRDRQMINRLEIGNIQCPPQGCPVPEPPSVSLGNATNWSDARTWAHLGGRLPREGEDITILSNMSVTLDVNPPRLGRLTIQGRLTFAPPALGVTTPRRLAVDAVVVWGELLIGTVEVPYNHSAGAELILNGVRTSQAVILDNSMFLGNKVIAVIGRFSAVGRAVVRSWTRLATTVLPGGTTIQLLESVAAPAGSDPVAITGWRAGDQIVITPTEYDPTEIETATIASVSADGRTVTLTAPLARRHYAGWALQSSANPLGRPVFLAAAVGLLTRNVVIRGNVTAPRDAFHATYGGHVYVGAINRLVTDRSGRRTLQMREGTVDLRWTQFDNMGKGQMEHGAINFQYGNYDLDPRLDTDGQSSMGSRVGRNPASTVHGCAFSFVHNYGLVAFAASNLILTNNTWHNSKRSAIDMDASSRNTTLIGNLVVGSFRSADLAQPDQFRWYMPQAVMMLLVAPRVMRDNYVAGSIDIGYSIRPQDCAAEAARGAGNEAYSGNEAVSVVVGVFILPSTTPSGCARMHGFTVWKASHIGIVAVDGLTDITVSGSAISDSHIGVSMNFVVGKRGQSRSDIVDSVIVGSSNASTCSASVTCRAYAPNDVWLQASASTCNSRLGNEHRRVGVLSPQYTNRGKTCAVDGGLDVCRPPQTPERLCSLPWEKRYGLPSTRHTHAYLTNVAFVGFSGQSGDCAKHSRAIMLNPTQSDMAVPFTMRGVTWIDTPLHARFYFAEPDGSMQDDDARVFALFVDADGSATGTPRTSIVSHPSVTVPSPACEEVTGWGGGYICPGIILRAAIIESLDRDRGFRRLGNIQYTRPAGDGSSTVSDLFTAMSVVNRTSQGSGPVDDSCPIRMYFAQYPFLVRPGTVNHILVPATHPQVTRLHFFSPDPNERVVIRMFVQRPNSQEVYVNGVQVAEKAAMNRSDLPTLTDRAGTFLFDPQDKHITFTMAGGYGPRSLVGSGQGAFGDWNGGASDTYDIVRLSSVQLSFKLAVDINTFFNGAGQFSLVNNLATLLGISPDRIKVVNVNPGSTNIALEILPPANATAQLLAAAVNASDTAPVVPASLDGTPVQRNSTIVEVLDDSGAGTNVTTNATTNATAPSASPSPSAAPSASPSPVPEETRNQDSAAFEVASLLLETHREMLSIVERLAELNENASLSSIGGFAVQEFSVVPPPAPTLGNTSGMNLTLTDDLTGPVVVVPNRRSTSAWSLTAQVIGGISAGVVAAVLLLGSVLYIQKLRARNAARGIADSSKGMGVGGKSLDDEFQGHNPMAKHARVPFPPATVPKGGSPSKGSVDDMTTVYVVPKAAPARVPSMSNLFPALFTGGSFRGSNPMNNARSKASAVEGSSDSPRASTRMGYGPQTVGNKAGAARDAAAHEAAAAQEAARPVEITHGDPSVTGSSIPGVRPHMAKAAWTNPSLINIHKGAGGDTAAAPAPAGAAALPPHARGPVAGFGASILSALSSDSKARAGK